eukprot:SAG31_NODE_4879_length_2888_cov_1.855145_2_plen_170_part_00
MVALLIVTALMPMAFSVYIYFSELMANSHHLVAFFCAFIALFGCAFTSFLCVAHTGFLCAGITTRQFWLEHYRQPHCCGRLPRLLQCMVLCCVPCLQCSGNLAINRAKPNGRPLGAAVCCPPCCPVGFRSIGSVCLSSPAPGFRWDDKRDFSEAKFQYFRYLLAVRILP